MTPQRSGEHGSKVFGLVMVARLIDKRALLQHPTIEVSHQCGTKKGTLIKQYGPYFAEAWEWEWEEALATVGVTPILTYDALGRLVKTELPNGATRRVC